jgi:hypothetical protein
MTEAKERTCENCKFGCLFDFGYSNYMVEGTEFFCAQSLHPDGHFDRFYGEDKRQVFAEKCTGFEEGEAIWMDVEQENVAELTPEQKVIYEKCQAAA